MRRAAGAARSPGGLRRELNGLPQARQLATGVGDAGVELLELLQGVEE